MYVVVDVFFCFYNDRQSKEGENLQVIGAFIFLHYNLKFLAIANGVLQEESWTNCRL